MFWRIVKEEKGNESSIFIICYKYRQLLGNENKFLWQSLGDLKIETECELILASRVQALQANKMQQGITNRNTDQSLRQEFDSTAEHIISARPLMTKELYISRLERVCVN